MEHSGHTQGNGHSGPGYASAELYGTRKAIRGELVGIPSPELFQRPAKV